MELEHVAAKGDEDRSENWGTDDMRPEHEPKKRKRQTRGTGSGAMPDVRTAGAERHPQAEQETADHYRGPEEGNASRPDEAGGGENVNCDDIDDQYGDVGPEVVFGSGKQDASQGSTHVESAVLEEKTQNKTHGESQHTRQSHS